MKTNVVLVFLLISTFTLAAQGTSPNCATNPPDFSKLSYESAKAAVYDEDSLIGRQAVKISAEYIYNLVQQLQYGHLSSDNKTLAIYLLGELQPKDTNAIEFLIENIDFKATKIEPPNSFPRWGKYPAEEALITIGKPVVNPILDHIPKEDNEFRRQLMCDVLREVL